jgi:hypothetical protein
VRRRGWAGPHPLLLAATVVLFFVATAMSSDPARHAVADTGAAAAQLASAPVQGPGLHPDVDAEQTVRAASDLPRQTVGVATYNAYKQLTLEETIADARTLAKRDGVDVIGWQEAYRMGRVRPELKKLGWRTEWSADGSSELAISWRTKRFAFVSAQEERVTTGVAPPQPYPVGPGHVLRVVLRDRTTGMRLSVLTTHLPQAIEQENRPGRWRSTVNADRARRQLQALARIIDRSPGRWVLATGDLNLDARADRRHRPRGGPNRALAGTAVSSYRKLGIGDLPPTHPVSGRHIDYLYAGAADVRQDRLEFLGQRTIGDVRSDHRALLVRVRLR